MAEITGGRVPFACRWHHALLQSAMQRLSVLPPADASVEPCADRKPLWGWPARHWCCAWILHPPNVSIQTIAANSAGPGGLSEDRFFCFAAKKTVFQRLPYRIIKLALAQPDELLHGVLNGVFTGCWKRGFESEVRHFCRGDLVPEMPSMRGRMFARWSRISTVSMTQHYDSQRGSATSSIAKRRIAMVEGCS